PSLGLSEAFDNFSATMRLAALTGMEKELDQYSETQKIARLKALADARRGGAQTLSGSATWQQEQSPARSAAPAASGGINLKYVWAGSAVFVVAAVALLLLR